MNNYTEQSLNLIINKMTKEQYHKADISGLINDTELYMITDDKSFEGMLSDYVPLSVTIGTQTAQNPLVDKQYVDSKTNDIKTLTGKIYDFSNDTDYLSAFVDVVRALGGTVNNPF